MQDTLSKEQTEEGRVEVLPVQWRKHLNLEVGIGLSGCCGCGYINLATNELALDISTCLQAVEPAPGQLS